MYSVTLPMKDFERLRADSEKLRKIENAISACYFLAHKEAKGSGVDAVRNPYAENFPRYAEDIIKMAEIYALTGKCPEAGACSGCLERKRDE